MSPNLNEAQKKYLLKLDDKHQLELRHQKNQYELEQAILYERFLVARELERLKQKMKLEQMPHAEIDTSQYYIGFRTFRLSGRVPKLYSSSIGGPTTSSSDWHPGDCIAICRRPPQFIQDRKMNVVKEHDAPNSFCHCGLYGCHSIGAVKTHTSGKLFAALQQWGKCILHIDGMRSQYARVIAFHYVREVLEGQTAVSADWVCMHGHTDCPVCGSIDERMKGNVTKTEPIPSHIKQLQELYNVPLFETIEGIETYASEFGQVIKL